MVSIVTAEGRKGKDMEHDRDREGQGRFAYTSNVCDVCGEQGHYAQEAHWLDDNGEWHDREEESGSNA